MYIQGAESAWLRRRFSVIRSLFVLFHRYTKSMPGGWVYMAGSSPAMTVVGTVFRSQACNELASNAAPHNI
jgi:hypothetical protein